MELINFTPYAVQHIVQLDRHAEETLAVIVKATFDLRQNPLKVHDKQVPIQMGDEYLDEPGKSSIKSAGETMLFKPATDVVLIGSAYSTDKNQNQVDVRLRVGEMQKTVRVFGDRVWEQKMFGCKATAPESFKKIPLTWERAFGGVDETGGDSSEAENRNPVGVGFRGRKSDLPIDGELLPNLEAVDQPIRKPNDRPEPAGFGFVAPHWHPRPQYAGTYDEKWQNSRAPLLPDDFDPHFHQFAPPNQIIEEELQPGTPVEVVNASPSGNLSFAIPKVPLAVTLRYGFFGESKQLQMKLDTVVIDGDHESLSLTFRGNTSVHNRIYEVRTIEIADTEYN